MTDQEKVQGVRACVEGYFHIDRPIDDVWAALDALGVVILSDDQTAPKNPFSPNMCASLRCGFDRAVSEYKEAGFRRVISLEEGR